MLVMPESGFSRSVEKHNVDLIAMVDWIEASTVFLGAATSKSDVVDVLCEEDVYDDQDFAAEIVDQAWQLLRVNAAALGANALVDVQARTVQPTGDWRTCAPTAFFLLLSIAPRYARLREKLAGDYANQGALFEQVTRDAIAARGWAVHSTGWQSGMAAETFARLVDGVQAFLREPLRVPDTEEYLTSANDAGLDLVCLWPYFDDRPAAPVMFVQCASGANWRTKLKTPDPELWHKMIPFIVSPTRAISIPFVLDEASFKKTALLQSGVLLDRVRLLRRLDAAKQWMNADAQQKVQDWVESKLDALEAAS